jgi:drug/metabolite transporter (DMT)-like permease
MAHPLHPRAVALLLVSAVFFSTGGLLIKWIEWPPMALASARGFIAAIVLWLLHRDLKFHWSWLQMGAALFCALQSLSFILSTKLTTAANAILLQYTAPIWVAILGAWLLKEHVTRRDIYTMAAVLVGVVCFFIGDLQWDGVLGNLIALAGGVMFAFFLILLRMQKDGSVIESIILGNILTALIGLPFLLSAPALSTESILILFVLAIFQLAIPYTLYAIAIKQVTALQAVMISVIEPILNPLWVMLVIHEVPSGLALLGGGIVLVAVTYNVIAAVRTTA